MTFRVTALAMSCKARLCGSVSSSAGKLSCFAGQALYLTLLPRVFTVFLMLYRVKGAILIGIFLTAIISWPRPTQVTYFPYNDAGDELFSFFRQIVTFHPLQHIGGAIDVSSISAFTS